MTKLGRGLLKIKIYDFEQAFRQSIKGGKKVDTGWRLAIAVLSGRIGGDTDGAGSGKTLGQFWAK